MQGYDADDRQDQKISFPKSLKDFDVDFSFSQQVHVLRQKSSQARFILENTIATVASLKVLADSIAQIIDLPSAVADSFRVELENTSSELRRQLLTARRLLLLSQDIKSMVTSAQGQMVHSLDSLLNT